MTKLLVVLGATGTQGGSVIKTYLGNSAWKIRGVTRDPSKPAAAELKAQGVEVVSADLDNVESLIEAFKGANMVFAVTDFWAPFFDPASQAKLLLGQTINEYCYETELSRGKNFVDALIPGLANLELLIWSSLADVSKWSGGKYTYVYHFDSKAHVYNYIHDKYPELDKKTSQLFVGSYMDNWKRMPDSAPRRQSDGSFLLTWCSAPGGLEPFVDTKCDTGKFVQALEKQGAGKKLFGVSDLRSGDDYVRLWSEHHGVKGKYKQISMEEYQRGLPKSPAAREAAESRAWLAEFGWNGGEPDVLLPKDLGIKTTTMEEYVAREDWSRVLSKI